VRRLAFIPAGLLVIAPITFAQTATFTGIGIPPGATFSFATGVSSDGSVVACGLNRGGGGIDSEACLWTDEHNIVLIGDLPGGVMSSQSAGISGDGSVVVGRSWSTNGVEAFHWKNGSMVGIGDLPGGDFQSVATAASFDGSIVVGRGSSGLDSLRREAFTWIEGVGMLGLGDLPGGRFQSEALSVSGDGGVVVGFGWSALGNEAFQWTVEDGMVGLGDLAGGRFNSVGQAVSADGSTVVGSSSTDLGSEAFIWTEATGMVGLGIPTGATGTNAFAVSGNGSVVVGSMDTPEVKAFIWDRANGIRELETVLTEDFEVDLAGWSLIQAAAISADGQTIVGNAFNPLRQTEGFIAFIPLNDSDGDGVDEPDDLCPDTNLSDSVDLNGCPPGQSDTTPPVLLDLQILTPSVDTSSGPADVELLVEYEDDLSGARLPSIVITQPDGTAFNGPTCVVTDQVGLHLEAICRYTVDTHEPVGTWRISNVRLMDVFFNPAAYSSLELNTLGVNTEFVHTGDTTPPTLLELQVLTPSIDTSNGRSEVEILVEYEDDLSGALLPSIILGLPDRTISEPHCVLDSQVGLKYVATCRRTLDSNDPRGTWTISIVSLVDENSNSSTIPRPELESFGFDTEFVLLEESPSLPDRDLDGVPDASDNCPSDSNPEQFDTDRDLVGDTCDNCPDHSNPGQTDTDRDSIGDVCDQSGGGGAEVKVVATGRVSSVTGFGTPIRSGDAAVLIFEFDTASPDAFPQIADLGFYETDTIGIAVNANATIMQFLCLASTTTITASPIGELEGIIVHGGACFEEDLDPVGGVDLFLSDNSGFSLSDDRLAEEIFERSYSSRGAIVRGCRTTPCNDEVFDFQIFVNFDTVTAPEPMGSIPYLTILGMLSTLSKGRCRRWIGTAK